MAQAIRPPRTVGRPGVSGQPPTRSDLLHPRHFRGRHHAATLLVVLALAVVGFRLFPGTDVTVLENGQSFRVSTTFDPGSEALGAASVSLEPGDRVVEGTGGRYLSLAVERARPVTIVADGQTFALRTQATTVAGSFAEAGIELRPGDRLYVDGQLTTSRAPLSAAIKLASRVAPGSATADPLNIELVRARPATVYFDGMRLDTMSAAPTVQELLADLGVTVREGDLVSVDLQSPVNAGAVIRLSKARTVAVTLDGQQQTFYTLAETVRDVIRLLDVTFDGDDQVFPSLDTPIVPNMQVTIMTTQVREVSAEEPIAPKVVDEYDPNRAEGDISVTEGVAGIKRVVYSVTYRNGVADAARTVLSSEVVQEAVPTRRVIGTKPRPGASKPTIYVSGGAPAVYRQKLHVVATWYNLDHGAFAADSPHYGTTASGAKAAWGTCAVDPSVIPMYTRFYVPGYGWCTALDTGGGIQGAHIDLFFPNEIGDPGWGVQYLDIYIVD